MATFDPSTPIPAAAPADKSQSFFSKAASAIKNVFTPAPKPVASSGLTFDPSIPAKAPVTPALAPAKLPTLAPVKPLVFSPEAPIVAPAPAKSLTFDPLVPAPSQPKVRQQDFKDVVNLLPQLIGGAMAPAAELGGTATKAVNKALGTNLPTKSTIPNVFQDAEHGGPNAVDTQPLQDTYAEHVKNGDSSLKAFTKTALQGGLDVFYGIAMGREFSAKSGEMLKGVAKGVAPEKLITPEMVTVARNDVHDILSGRIDPKDSPLPKDVLDAIKAAPDKVSLAKSILRGEDVDVETLRAKPSRLGELLGVTDKEATQIMNDLYDGPVRNKSKALPGNKPINPRFAGMSAGMSTEAVERVGGEYPEIPKENAPSTEVSPETPKEPQDLAEKATKELDPKTQRKVAELESQLSRVSQSLRAYEANPAAHIKAYNVDRKPVYQNKINELKERIAKLKNPPQKVGATEAVVGEKPAVNEEHSRAMTQIEDEAMRLEAVGESLNNNPARALMKYAPKSGENPGVLPDFEYGSHTKKTSRYARFADVIVPELGFETPEDAKEAFEKYQKQLKQYRTDIEAFKTNKKTTLENFKASLSANDFSRKGLTDTDFKDYYADPKITESNIGVVPPAVRGGLRSPEIDWSLAKDKAAIRLGRDTMERNIEKVFPKAEAEKLKNFLVEATRANDLERVKYVNDLRLKIRAKVKEFGVKRNSDDDALIQVFGEGRMTLEDLQRATKNWEAVQRAADYFRKLYDGIIEDWNVKRRQYNYPDVGKRKDYFRHFSEVNEWTQAFGLLSQDAQLPTSIAGITDNFKPGKSFTTAELHRTGDRTKFSALGGMDNYLDSVGKQMFHIDSIQRGRAVEKYIREAARVSEKERNPATGVITPLKLQNFASNLNEWTNFLAGKSARLDRALESTFGRPALKVATTLTRLFGRNVIAGNVSAAVSHLIPTIFNVSTVNKPAYITGMLDTLIVPLRESSALVKIDGQESSFLLRRFPEKHILPSNFEKTEDTLGFIFHTADQLISRLAVASKYYEARGLGWQTLVGTKSVGLTPEAAMKVADNYAQRVIGDRSIGNLPNIMNAKTVQIVTQFQVEINDNLQVLMHDIPQWNEGSKWKIGSAFVQFAIFSYLFNEVLKHVKGSGKGLDPIDMGLTIMGLNDEGRGQGLATRTGLASKDLLGELPFSSLFTGGFPLQTALAPASPLASDLASGNMADAGKQALKLGSTFVSPVGGGAQALKTVQGIEAVNAGHTDTSKGQINSAVEKTPGNYIKGALFGPTALNAESSGKVNALFNLVATQTGSNASLLQEAENLDKKYSGMAPQDANKELAALKASNLALYNKVVSVAKERKAGLTQEDRLIKMLGVANKQRAMYVDRTIMAITDGDPKVQSEKRNAYLKELVDKKVVTPEVLTQIKEIHKNGGTTPAIQNGTKTTSSNILSRVVAYAKAIGTDPVSAFHDIFTGQTIKSVSNGQILVDRMSFAESSQDRKDMSAGAGMILDHIVPLEAGGTNDKSNLQLVSTAEDGSGENQPLEDYLGKALKAGTITGAQAREAAIRFKAGQGQKLTPELLKEYKDKYGSKPMSLQDVLDGKY